MKQLIAGLALGSVLITGCAGMNASADGEMVPVSQLQAAVHCGREQADPALHYLDDSAGMAWARQRIGARPADPVPELDPAADAALLLEMGLKPTGGYGLQLAEPRAALADGVLRLKVNWRTPEPDRLLTQALTSPCLLIKLPRGDYRAIEVLDQHGALRARLAP